MRRRALLLALLAAPALRAQEIEVIALRHRTAEEVLPHLRAFLEPGGALTGQGYQLFVRASASNVRQLKQLLATLDRAPRQLVITVRQDRAEESATRIVGADGSVTLSTRHIGGSVGAAASDARTVGTAGVTQTIRVLEGGRAYVAIGTSIPLTFRRWSVEANGVTEARGTVFYEAVTGFHVRPQLAGDVVTLELAPEQASFSGGPLESAQISTTVRGRLGEWIAVGGADTRADGGAGGIGSATSSTQSVQRGVWLKVDAVDSPR
ncbi:MAG: secretin N-terminal domain-containing protein [Gemmatimonadota bacterium]